MSKRFLPMSVFAANSHVTWVTEIISKAKTMKTRSSLTRLRLLTGIFLTLSGSLSAQTVTWNRQAYGQGPFYVPGHQGDPLYAFFYPNNNYWSQQLTFEDPAHPPSYEIAPSNWSTDTFPNGSTFDVTLSGTATNFDRDGTSAVGGVTLHSLTIAPSGGLNMEFNTRLTVNIIELQGDDTNDATLSVGGAGGAFPVLILSAGGVLKKTTGNATFTLDPALDFEVYDGATIECDSGTLTLPSNGSNGCCSTTFAG
jgi:hypothetical protein